MAANSKNYKRLLNNYLAQKEQINGTTMKARIKATGEIAEFSTGKNLQGEIILLKVGTASIFLLNEVEPINDIDYNQVRIQASIAAMQGMIANPQTFEQLDNDKGYQEVRGGDKSQIVAIASVMYADALVAELQKKGDNDV